MGHFKFVEWSESQYENNETVFGWSKTEIEVKLKKIFVECYFTSHFRVFQRALCSMLHSILHNFSDFEPTYKRE